MRCRPGRMIVLVCALSTLGAIWLISDGPAAQALPQAEEPDKQELERQRAQLEHEMQIAAVKLEQAKLEMEVVQQQSESELDIAHQEAALAERRLASFDEMTAPTRRASAELDLQAARDSLRESEQELEQLRMMYAEQDLADQTREIVLERGARRVERSAARLAIQEQELAMLVQHTLPQERQDLAIEHERKRREIERRMRERQVEVLSKQIGIMTAEAELDRLRRERAGLS